MEAIRDDASDAYYAYQKGEWSSAKQAYSQHQQRLGEKRTSALYQRQSLQRTMAEVEKLQPKVSALALVLDRLADESKPVLQQQHDDAHAQLETLLSTLATTCGHIADTEKQIAELEAELPAVNERWQAAEKTLESLRERVQAAERALNPHLSPRTVSGVDSSVLR